MEVLQGFGDEKDHYKRRWPGIADVRAVMETPTSVGGIPERGVSHGLAIIDQAVAEGGHFFIRSDIKNFFSAIPKLEVNAFIKAAVGDAKFTALFEEALATNLENQEELEERNYFKLFPDPEIGVAQGSALSALAGNIALQEFDSSLNGRGIRCVRYIDDFIILGPSESKVRAAYKSAKSLLAGMGMDVYELEERQALKTGKVDSGNLFDGTDFLGYRISGHARQPSQKARSSFLKKLDVVVKDGKAAMKAAAKGDSHSRHACYYQSMVQLNKIVWGWSQSFRHTTNITIFQQLDKEIEKRISSLHREVVFLARDANTSDRRRVTGVHLLADTSESSLPSINLTA